MSTRDDRTLAQAYRVGRPRRWPPVEPRLVEWLREDEGLPSIELLRRVREGYPDGKSAVYELIWRLRPVTAGPAVRFKRVPGQFSQHDFGLSSPRR